MKGVDVQLCVSVCVCVKYLLPCSFLGTFLNVPGLESKMFVFLFSGLSNGFQGVEQELLGLRDFGSSRGESLGEKEEERTRKEKWYRLG